MKYLIKVVETLEKTFCVDAKDLTDALQQVEDARACEDIVLYADDFSGYEIVDATSDYSECDKNNFPLLSDYLEDK